MGEAGEVVLHEEEVGEVEGQQPRTQSWHGLLPVRCSTDKRTVNKGQYKRAFGWLDRGHDWW